MITVVIVVGIVLLLALGFYLTRGAGGPPPLEARGRFLDQRFGRADALDDTLDADKKADSESE